jgi:hypothetical protein
MRRLIFALALAPLGAGCTSTALERYTVAQIASVADVRYQEVVDNLARVAANPAVLPSLAVVADGTAQVVDSGTIDAKTLWMRAMFRGFSMETLTLSGYRSPQPYWTLEPVSDHEKVEAAWAALRWAVWGPPSPGSPPDVWLKTFQVDKDLEALPPGWLGVGGWKDVPKGACYKAHCHGHWVWVTPEGMEGLSALTLVLLDIATVDLNSLRAPGQVKVKVEIRRRWTAGADQGKSAQIEDNLKAAQPSPGGPILVQLPPKLPDDLGNKVLWVTPDFEAPTLHLPTAPVVALELRGAALPPLQPEAPALITEKQTRTSR